MTRVPDTEAEPALPAWSYAVMDHVVAVPGLAVWFALVIVGPYVAVAGAVSLTSFSAALSAARPESPPLP